MAINKGASASTSGPTFSAPTPTFRIVPGQNDPSKRPPAKEVRDYNKGIGENWEEGCPYCEKKLSTYGSFRNHVSSRCPKRPNKK